MLKHYRKHGRYSREDAARVAGVSVRVWNEYEDGKRKAPAHVHLIARAVMFGDLGQLSPAWRGWRMAGDSLVSPTGETFTPGQVNARTWDVQLIAELRRQVRELSAPFAQLQLI
ncbi:MAG: hypothetical protein H6980_11195 [Gammaproteobacteria bacterium]|nr:hypothetical protein [Gammaproteobacteria bacterium]